MKPVKRFAALAAALTLFFLCAFPASAANGYPSPTSDFFVNDFAECISESDKTEMQNLGVELYKKTGAQVVVVTVNTLGGADIESYSIGLARDWEIGDSEDNSGVLLLLSVSDRQVRIEVGKGLEGRLTDGKTGRILDEQAIPYLSKDDFSTGLLNAYKAVVAQVYAEYGDEGYTSSTESYDDESSLSYRQSRIMSTVITAVIFLIAWIIYRKIGGRGGFFFFGGHGGGFSGGISSGGGFSSGGGSSGGFSGGGGGFSGGGSSRGF